jgi:alanyl-tRNA synthetase
LYDLREKYIEEKKKEEKKLLKQKLNDLFLQIDEIIKNADAVNGIKIISQKIELNNSEEFKEIGESFRNRLKNGVALIASIIDGKINLVCIVSDNLIKEKNLNAGKLISEVAKELGGGGGGRPHLATAGGKNIDKLDSVLKSFLNKIKNQI